jgi:hypothetical protein
VTGIFFQMPPILRMSCSSDIAWITARAEEQQRLEEGMREQVEDRAW